MLILLIIVVTFNVDVQLAQVGNIVHKPYHPKAAELFRCD